MHYKDQMREVIPVAEAFAVGESQLADEALQRQRLEEEQARLAEQQARLEEQRQVNQERRLNQERQARLRSERQMAEAEHARQQAEHARLEAEQARLEAEQARLREQRQLEYERQARLQAERRLAELQDTPPPVSFPDSKPRKTSTTTPNEEKAGRSKVLLGVTIVLLVMAVVGGICGSGNCSRQSSAASENVPFSSSSVPKEVPPNMTSMPSMTPLNFTTSTIPMGSNFSSFATDIPSTAVTPIPSTAAPTMAPLPQPTLRPLPPPTPTRSPVTPRPTQSPVTRATSPPIIPPSPRPVVSPASQPTLTIFRSELIVSYINSVTLSRRTLSYPNSNELAEEEALNWLIEDEVGTNETDQRSLRQRFALATLWFANGPFDSAHLDTWLTSMDECDWGSIGTCVGGEVTRVVLSGDGLNGQLPSDLALLTALTYLNLNGNQLTGTIPTELTQLATLTQFWVFNNNLSGDMPFCDGAMRPTRFTRLEADCNEVSCPCCTECCPKGGFDGIPSAGSFLNPCDA